jgi:hypothetical protein
MAKDNHCTFFFEGFSTKYSWTHCCAAHDKAYELQLDKKQADIDLYNCVRDADPTSITWIVAALMLAGVSLFGSRFYKKK